ncbi:MAG: DUF4342 domain-containing protein [Anaerolineae bacterium]|jgi:hypothetical protein
MSEQDVRREELHISGQDLVDKVKQLLHEGNVRRIIVRGDEGRTVIEIPLTVGLVGIVLVPVWVAIGAIAALVTDCTIVVERHEA